MFATHPLVFVWTVSYQSLYQFQWLSGESLISPSQQSNCLPCLPSTLWTTEHPTPSQTAQFFLQLQEVFADLGQAQVSSQTPQKIYFPYLTGHRSPPGFHCFALQCRTSAVGNRVTDIVVTLPLGGKKKYMEQVLCFIYLQNVHHFLIISYVLPVLLCIHLLLCFLPVPAKQSRYAPLWLK